MTFHRGSQRAFERQLFGGFRALGALAKRSEERTVETLTCLEEADENRLGSPLFDMLVNSYYM